LVTGAEISHRAIIGPGLGLLHPTGVLIGGNVKIGKMATICNCCFISTQHYLDEKGPIIGNYLWAGPGCAILGKIILGNNVWIGPNASILKDIYSHMTVMGNPARAFPTDEFRKISFC
jgi:serine O-acetyltransferase